MNIKLGSAANARIVLISGTESSLREKALALLIQEWETGPEDFDCETVVANEKGPADWIASASTTPFLGTHRTVIVRHLLRLGSVKEIDKPHWEALLKLPETGRIILVVDDETGDEAKQRDLASLATSWEKAVAALKHPSIKPYAEVISLKMEANQLQDFLIQEAQAAGKTLSRAGAALIAEKTAQSVTLAAEELTKLVLFVGDRPAIREADIESSVITTREWNVFKMIDAAIAGRSAEAHRHLRILVESASKADETAFRSIFPTLHSQLRLFWQARLYLEAKAIPGQDDHKVHASLPTRPVLAKEPEWKRNKTMQLARSLTLPQIAMCLRELGDADARLKGQLHQGASSLDVLELLLQRVSQHLRPAA